MKNLLKLEQAGLLLLSIFLFPQLEVVWWFYPLLFFAPDLGAAGYLAGPRTGALTYNLLHHQAVAIVGFIAGVLLNSDLTQAIGLILLGHSSLDRVFGYGLKHMDGFRHTHLGWIGRGAAPAKSELG